MQTKQNTCPQCGKLVVMTDWKKSEISPVIHSRSGVCCDYIFLDSVLESTFDHINVTYTFHEDLPCSV